MRIAVVLAEQNAGWVIGKMAHRLAQSLRDQGCEASVGPSPDPAADVNHWMSFAFADGCPGTLNTMFVTHADDMYKVRLIKERLTSDAVQMALCMSPHAARELAEFGVPAQRLWHVLPAMDCPLRPRLINIGITTRVYDDGRKRESFLIRLAREMRLDAFRFRIFGAGWDAVIEDLRRAGAVVDYDPGTDDWQGDYVRIQQAIPDFDYYLYMGMDEGSLGTLDAASAGVKTIVTAQGFHLALPGGIDHPFVDYRELRAIFQSLASRSQAVIRDYGEWSWQNYAREHMAVWKAMLAHRAAAVPVSELQQATRRGAGGVAVGDKQGKIASRNLRFYLRVLEPKRIRGGIARLRFLQPLRKLLKR